MAKRPKSNASKYIAFSGIAIQIGVTIWLGNLLGAWLAEKYNKEFLEPVITLIAVFIAIASVIISVIKMSKDD